LVSFVDGHRPLREVAQLSGLPGPIARAHLQTLFERGVLIAADPRAGEPRTGSTPPGLPVLASALPASLAPPRTDGPSSGELRPGQRITREQVSGGSSAIANAGAPADAGAADDLQPRVTLSASDAVKVETPALWGRAPAVVTPSPVVTYQPPALLP